MTGKGWTTQVAAAAGAAAGTSAAQLGLGYGLGVVVWPVAPTPDDSVWLGSLGWATWIAASATVFGAVIAARLRGAQAPRLGGPWRFALAASAAVGALLTVALVAVPARPAVRADTFAPEMIAGGYAVIGIVLGLVIAYWAVVSRAVAANLIATAGYLWALAAAGIVVELTLHRESATYLTSWQFAELGTQARYGTIYWPSALLTLLAALIIGMIAAWPSVRRGNLGVGAASSGAVGPMLVAAAFLVLAPQLTGALGQLQSAYLIAPYAVLAGLAGSALVVAGGRRSAERRAARIKRIHRPAPPAATGKAAVPADADVAQLDTPPTGTPQLPGVKQSRRSGRTKTSAPRSTAPAESSAAAQTPDQGQASAARPGRTGATAARPDQAGPSAAAQSPDRDQAVTARPGRAGATAAAQTAESESGGDTDQDRATESSDRPGLWGRLRRGGQAKPSVPTSSAEVTGTPDPAPSSAPQGGADTAAPASSGASAAVPSPRSAAQPSTAPRSSEPAARPAQGGRAASGAGKPAPAKGNTADPTGTKEQPRASARSTVAAPPTAPPIAKINPPLETAAGSAPKSTRPAGKTTPPKAAPAKATPPAKSTSANPQPDKPE